MKCSNDGTEMEKGSSNGAFWISGDKPWAAFQFTPGRTSKYIIAYRCSKCGKVEMYTEK